MMAATQAMVMAHTTSETPAADRPASSGAPRSFPARIGLSPPIIIPVSSSAVAEQQARRLVQSRQAWLCCEPLQPAPVVLFRTHCLLSAVGNTHTARTCFTL